MIKSLSIHNDSVDDRSSNKIEEIKIASTRTIDEASSSNSTITNIINEFAYVLCKT